MADKAQDNGSYLYTLEYLVKKMIDPGEEFSNEEKPVLKIDDFKEIFNSISGETVDAILHGREVENYA
jgi:hypothetical protein